MASLSIINKTLQEQTAIMVEQTKASERMAVSIDDVREQITRMIETQMSVYDMIENSRERPEFGDRGGPRGLPSPGQGAGGSTGESAGLTAMQNLFNNIFGGLAGGVMSGALGSRLVGGVIGLLGKGLKWGLIAYAADQILNAVFENFDVPPELAQELQGDTRRAVFATAAASMLGLRGKWLLIAAAAGFFYDEANKLVNWITENSEAARAAMQWFEDKTGIPAQPLVAGTLAAGGTLAAWEGGKRLLGGARSLAWKGIKAAPQLIQRAGAGMWNAAKTAAPVVASAVKSGLKSAYSYGMKGLTTAGTIGMAPLTAFAGTMALLGSSTSEYKQMLQDYPEMAPMNNGAGPGLVRGKYLIQNGLIDEAIEYEKQKGTYRDRPVYETTREAPDPTSMSIPSGEINTKALADYLATTAPLSTPLVTNPDIAAIEQFLSSTPDKPQVVVVPVPTPAPAAPSRGAAGGSAVFTAPIGTTDRLDHRDRISRPW